MRASTVSPAHDRARHVDRRERDVAPRRVRQHDDARPAGRARTASGSSSSPSVTTMSGWPAPSARSTAGRTSDDASRGALVVSPRRRESPNTNTDSAPTRRTESRAARQSAGVAARHAERAVERRPRGSGARRDAGASSSSATMSVTATKRSKAATRAPHPPRRPPTRIARTRRPVPRGARGARATCAVS